MKRVHNINEEVKPFLPYHPIISSSLISYFSIYFRIRLITDQFLRVQIRISKINREPDCTLVSVLGNQNKILQYNTEEIIQYLKEISEVKDTGLSALEYRNLQLKSLKNLRRWRRLFDQLTDTDIMYSRVINQNTVKFLLSGDEISLLDDGTWKIYQKKVNFGYNVSTKNIYKIKYQVVV